jgi:hypothetical protein
VLAGDPRLDTDRPEVDTVTATMRQGQTQSC